MQTTLSDILKNYGVESGLIAPEPAVVEIPPEDNDIIDGDLSELVEHRADEITRGMALVESLESMAARLEAGVITEESLESYRFNLECVLRSSGMNFPVSLIAPSFESAEADKKSVGQKVKGAIDAAIKWIREKIKALFDMMGRLFSKAKRTKEAAAKAGDEAKEYAKKYGDDGITKIASDGFAEKYKAQEGKSVKIKKMVKLPGWMTKGDQIAWAELDKVISVCTGAEVTKMFEGNYRDADDARSSINQIMGMFPGGSNEEEGKSSSEYEVDIPKISGYIDRMNKAIASIHGKMESLQDTVKGMEKRLARFANQGREMKPEEKKQITDDIVIFKMAIASADRLMLRPALCITFLKRIVA